MIGSQFQNVQFCPKSRKAKILTVGIYGIFRGLRFEADAEIGHKVPVFRGLSHSRPFLSIAINSHIPITAAVKNPTIPMRDIP